MKDRLLAYVPRITVGFLVICCTLTGPVKAQTAHPKRVLVLHSYHQGFVWTDAIQDGIEAALEGSGIEYEIYVEYMDTKRFAYEQYEQLVSLYRNKYSHHLPDVIVSSDDNALQFLLGESPGLFPGVPIVFCAVDHFSDDLVAPYREWVTGVVEGIDIQANLDLGLQLRPSTEHVVVVADTSPIGEANKAAVRELVPQYQHRADFTYLTDLTLAELEGQLREVPEDAMVLYLHFSLDSSGTYYSLQDSISAISQASWAPVYGSWDFSVKYGATGGYVTNGFVQGNTAAKMALRILSGEDPLDVEIVRKSPNTYMFNYEQMKRVGINESELPAGSIVINKPFSLYDEYKHLIWGSLVILAFLLLLIVALTANVARRRQAEEALRKERDLVTLLMETSPAGIVMVNRDGDIVFANAHAEKVLGLDKEEITQRTYNAPEWRITAYDGGPFPNEQLPFLRAMNTAKPVYDVRHAIEWPDGRRVLLSINASPLFDELRQVNGMVAAVEDVTQRVQAEDALQQRTAQLETLQKMGVEVTAHLDLDALLRSVISRSIELIGGDEGGLYLYRPEQDALEWAMAIGPRVAPAGSILHRGEGLSGKVWETGKPLIVDDYQHWEGRAQIYKEHPFASVVGIPIRWGEEFLGVLNVLADAPYAFSSANVELLGLFANQAAIAIQNARLHQQVLDHAEQLEQRVRERTLVLQAQHARLNAILQSTTDGIVVTDQEGNVVQANPVAQTWLTQTLSSEDAGRLRDAVQNLAQHVEEMPRTVLELTGLDLALGAAPVIEQRAEKPLGVVVDIHDVSHLREIDRMKTMFINNVSHELRTPIATIQSYAYLMQRTPPKRQEWNKYLDTLIQETNHQAQLGEDILKISQIYSGRLEPDLRPISLNQLTEAVIAGHQMIAREHRVRLESRLAKSDSMALMDPRQMQTVLNYLVSDAIRYTPDGGQVTVSTGQKETDDHTWSTVTVSDTGEAIPEEDQPHVFERFFRKEEPQSARVTETGLRLMIVKGIVELHKGRVTVESEKGTGSTFAIWLPVVN